MTTLRHRSAAPTNDSAASRNFLAPKKTLYDRVTYFVSLLVGTILNPIESEKERVATGIMFSFLSGCILLALRFLNLSQYSFWVGTLSILFLYTLRFAKKRFFPTPIVARLFEKDAPESKLEADEHQHQRQPILTPVQNSDSIPHPSGNYSHGFSLTDQQYLSLQHERAQHAGAAQAQAQAQRAPRSGVLGVVLYIARTLCDLGPLLVCIFGGIVGYHLGPKKIRLTGAIPSGFPSPLEPWYGFSDGLIDGGDFGTVLYHAATICVVVYLSSIAMAKRLAIARGQDINTDQELMGLGMASIVCGFFQAMPPTGGMSRTAVNFMNARTQLSSVITTLLIIVSLYTLTGTLYYLPRATLASIIIVAGTSLIEFREAQWLYKVRRDEFWVWTLSFILTLGLGVLDGLIGSIIVSVLALMYKSKTTPIAILGELPDGALVDRKLYHDAHNLGDVVAIRVESSLFFANCERVAAVADNEIARLLHEGIRVRGVVIDAQYMNDMDATTIQVFSDMQEKLEVRKVRFAVANAKGKIHDVIANTNLLQRLVGRNPSLALDEAVRALRDLAWVSGASSPKTSHDSV
ncbi:hypothetical protein PybrP1_010451 [[Pythium] brassicae (nom. inval.)]|nr:hypothetical protein PybrP1_010451 [[Pythium] brassicae (nom. inval.)]